MIFLGIDAGTTSMKAALFDGAGKMLAIDRQEYMLLTPSPAMVELDAEIYWSAFCQAVKNILARSNIPPEEVVSICISSQGETFIPVDTRGHPLRRAIVWLDNRAVEEAKLIADTFGQVEFFHKTGQPESTPNWPAPKVLWIKRNEPQVFINTHKFLLLEDYLIYRLTGQFVTECAQQTSTLFLDIQRKVWWREMFDLVGSSPEQFGRLLDPGVIVGPITKRGAEAIDLTEKTVVISGSMDQAIGAVGAGNISPGVVTESTGGALGIVATLLKPIFDPQRRIPCYIHSIKDTYCLLPWGQTAGMALKWFRDQFFGLEAQVAREKGLDPYEAMTSLAQHVAPGSDGLVVLPHLEGAFCPEFEPKATAVFFGATLRHTRAHFIRAIMESVAFMLRKNLDLLEALGIPITEVRSMGGGARSNLWLQIKADVLQKPVATVEVEESACLGAAILGAVATGYYPSLPEAVSHMVHFTATIMPNQQNEAIYQQRYLEYVELFDRLAPMFKNHP